MNPEPSATVPCPAKARYRLGVVRFLNTLPLIDGLEKLTDLELVPDVPARLIDLLISGKVDAALCSIIDYARSPEPLVVLPSGVLGSDGSTMTVRLFSQVPIDRIEQVHCDTDSHTSVILLRVLLHEHFQIKPELISFDASAHHANGRKDSTWPEAMLVIGDKVVTEPTPAIRYPYQLDLGQQWKDHTGLPFVFAAWLAKATTDAGTLCAILDRQRRYNRHTIDKTIASRAVALGWPVDLARLYVNEMLRYEWTDAMKQSVARFFDSAHQMGLIDQSAPLVFYSS